MYPTRITDAHGNFITVTYAPIGGSLPNNGGCAGGAEHRDDYGYARSHDLLSLQRTGAAPDGNGLLTSVTGAHNHRRPAPGIVRLQYQWLTLSNAGANYGFGAGLTPKRQRRTTASSRDQGDLLSGDGARGIGSETAIRIRPMG